MTKILVSSWFVYLFSWVIQTYAYSHIKYKAVGQSIRMLYKTCLEYNVDEYRFYPAILGCLILILKFIWMRFAKPKLDTFLFKKIKKGFLSDDIEKLEITSDPYSGFEFLDQTKGFFIGNQITEKKKKTVPLYLPEKHLFRHMMVQGSSGSGKTEGVLKNMMVQAIQFGYPTVFIDGKADAQLASSLHEYAQNAGRKMYIFNTTTIQQNNKTIQSSNTFNPLMFSKNANQLADALALSLQLDSESDSRFYMDAQKAFLQALFSLFLAINQPFTFIDILEFMTFEDTRKHVFEVATKLGKKEAVLKMTSLLETFDKNLSQLLGLRNLIDQLFCGDERVSELINTTTPDINIDDILNEKAIVLFSISSGDKYRANHAIAKFALSIINNSVSTKQGRLEKKEGWLVLLDEFGQYATEAIRPLIATARSTNTSIVLSFQNKEQLQNIKGLYETIDGNTDTKIIFSTQKEAEDWSKVAGTKSSTKRSDVLVDDVMFTESREGKSSLREVDEFVISPNHLRKLGVGQAVIKYSDHTGAMQVGIFSLPQYTFQVPFYPELGSSVPTNNNALNLQEKRKIGLIATPSFEEKKHIPKENTQQPKPVSEEERIYLNVRFEEKEEAKKNGARWDSEKIKWYAYAPLSEPLKKYC